MRGVTGGFFNFLIVCHGPLASETRPASFNASDREIGGSVMSADQSENLYWRAILSALLGAFVGAPVGAMLAACVAAMIGSVDGFVHGLGKALSGDFPLGFLLTSIENIGKGAGPWAGKWTVVGAKIGPFVGAASAFFWTYIASENEEEPKSDGKTKKQDDDQAS